LNGILSVLKCILKLNPPIATVFFREKKKKIKTCGSSAKKKNKLKNKNKNL